jgi:superfamily I DNA/RNA helicase
VARTEFLIDRRNLAPSSIVNVTFTRKAATGLCERLAQTLGTSIANCVRAGTFHKLSLDLLRKHGALIGINTTFTICNQDDK